jgi:uncharacterized membrane protein YheB (UPF0754 family)
MDNIMAIPDSEIESILTSIAKREFVAIEILGAVIGLIIGGVNAAMLFL